MKSYILDYFHHLKTTEKVWLRRGAGILLMIGGALGFLPILGYWMFPLGLALLAVDLPWARWWYRRMYVAWGRTVGVVVKRWGAWREARRSRKS